MNFKTFLTLTFCFIISSKVFAQNTATNNLSIKGTTFDVESNQPLAYVSVGVLNKSQGTLSDSTGNFSFFVTKENMADTLQISFVGYSTKKIAVKDFIESNNHTIGLAIRFTALDEVIVPGEKMNTEIIGRQASGKLIQVSIHHKTSAAETIGSEMGMRYKTDRGNAILKDFNFYLSANNFNSIKFRLNIYSVKNDMHDTLLYDKQIFATVDQFKTGLTKLDLKQYGIKVNHDFIITLQWVEGKMEKQENPVTIVPVALTPFSKNCYVRIASQDRWKRMGTSMSNFITLAY